VKEPSSNFVAVSPDGTQVASGNSGAEVKLWAVTGGRSRATVAYRPDGKTLASGSQAKTIQLWDASNSKIIKTVGE
jgi:WD40 repeat protein